MSHSVFSCALFVTFPYFVYVLQFWCLIIFYDRKDIYGVYAEPVDPEEVSLLVTSLDIWGWHVGSLAWFGYLFAFSFSFLIIMMSLSTLWTLLPWGVSWEMAHIPPWSNLRWVSGAPFSSCMNISYTLSQSLINFLIKHFSSSRVSSSFLFGLIVSKLSRAWCLMNIGSMISGERQKIISM